MPNSDIYLSSRSTPANFKFETHDASSGLLKYDGLFDIIHARCVSYGTKDWRSTVHELARILRPGGMLLLFDPDLQGVYDPDRRLIVAQEETSPVRSSPRLSLEYRTYELSRASLGPENT